MNPENHSVIATLDRRRFLHLAAASGVTLIFAAQGATTAAPPNAPAVASGPFALPPLPYAFDALEPHIDTQTMQIHHGKHHAAYVNNLNAALKDAPANVRNASLDDLLRHLNDLPESVRTAVRNNGGGHHNHSLFWESMAPNSGGDPTGKLGQAITAAFGSAAALKQQINEAAMRRFGSGWGWLAMENSTGKLHVLSTPNQDSPLMENKTPLLGVDVWEHAYYLKYQNRRADYLAAWWNTVNWNVVARRFDKGPATSR